MMTAEKKFQDLPPEIRMNSLYVERLKERKPFGMPHRDA